MINYALNKNPQPTQSPEVRCGNFEEVHKSYSETEAVAEAMRCLNCRKHPCMDGCPTAQRIPEFIECVAHGDFEGAWDIISTRSCMPAVCGRVCPQERQCEGHCTRADKGEAVSIGALERFVADWHHVHTAENDGTEESESGESEGNVAVIGAGPAGLSCAGYLARMGYDVTVYDSMDLAGGVLTYGIPQFRLPYVIVEDMMGDLKKEGVKFVMNTFVGRDITIDQLFKEGADAVFIGIGAEKRNTLDIPNIDAPGVVSAYDYLARINAMVSGREPMEGEFTKAKHVVIVGAGNVSMDASRSAKRMGAEDVTIAYRRSVSDSTATQEELKQAGEEGVVLCEYAAPAAIVVDDEGRACGIECVKTIPGPPDESGRRSPIPVEGSNFVIPADLIVLALGARPESSVFGKKRDDMMTSRGVVLTDESGATNIPGVFAGGDAVSGAATVVKAMRGGETVAESIDSYIKGKKAGKA